MKKYIALFLALALALGTAAALAETDVTGIWYADLGGAAAELTLNADGGYRLYVPLEEDKTGTWKLDDGFVYLDGARTPELATWGANALMLGDSAGFFTREKPWTYTPADVIADAPASLFAGLWRSAYIMQNGAALPADFTDDDTLIYIEELKALLKGGSLGYQIVDLTFDNGALTCDNEGVKVQMMLQSDGILRLTVTGTDTAPQTWYMTQAYSAELDGEAAEPAD